MLQSEIFNNSTTRLVQHDLDQTGCAILELKDGSKITISLYDKAFVQEAYEYLDLFPEAKVSLVLETLNHRELNRTLAHLRVANAKGFLSKTAMEELRSGYSSLAYLYDQYIEVNGIHEYFYK